MSARNALLTAVFALYLGCSSDAAGFGRYTVSSITIGRPAAGCNADGWSPDGLRAATVDYTASPDADAEIIVTRGGSRVCRMFLTTNDFTASEVTRNEACTMGPTALWPMRGLLIQRDGELTLSLGWTSPTSTPEAPCAARLDLALTR